MEKVFCRQCKHEIDRSTVLQDTVNFKQLICLHCSQKDQILPEMKESTTTNADQNTGEKETFPKHIIIIRGDPLLYKCTICDKTFKTKSNCCYHKHCADDSEKPYSCATCNRKFSSKTHFTYHNFMHTGENPFKCDQCDKSFKTKNKLIRHQEVHSDKRKLYQCDLCDRSFLRKTSIKVHRKSHTGEKPYNCSHCSKAFSEKKKLINHIASHTGNKDWVCEVCGKSYSIKWNLELHKRTHSKVRPYYCEECQQSFSQNRYLKRHMETHKNSVKYLCNLCDKEFSRKDNLQRHIVNTHLEYENHDSAKMQKITFYNNPSSLITKVVTNDEFLPKIPPSLPPKPDPPLRTESVIKSLTKTQQIVDFRCEDIESQSNRISVIKKVGKSLPNAHTEDLHHCQSEPQQFHLLQSIPEPIIYDVPAKEDINIDAQDSIKNWDDSVREHFAEYSTAREMVKSPRCFLPKKLITASYKERSLYNERACHRPSNLTVIMSTEK